LEQRLLRRWRALGLSERASITLGFSGGPDSLALAACLAHLRPLLGAQVRLLHVDHRLRPTSSADAERAMDLAAKLGFECVVDRLPAHAVSNHEGVGIEEAARRERYRSYARVVAGDDQPVIALGHHQMDQAETVLLHLLRGAGLHGAAGMAELSEIDVPWWVEPSSTPVQRLHIWRPFLSESRDVVRDYVQASGLVPIEDETNQSVAFQRNAVRHQLLPILEQLSPGATGALARFATLAAEDDRFLTSEALKVLAAARSGRVSLAIEPLAGAPLSLRRRAIFLWLSEFGGIEPSQDRIDAIVNLVERRLSGSGIQIGGGYLATIAGPDLMIQRA
jgi:tRNA(Ile)-lysidine synthetase-like protein